jgi:hypothetical protein
MTLLAVAWGQASTAGSPMVARTAPEARDANLVSPATFSSGDPVTSRPLPGVPPLPGGKATLFGGTIYTVLQVFGGKKVSVLFDERTRMFRDGKTISPGELQKGDRAYLDTTLDGTDIFVRNVRIASASPSGQSSGQIVGFDSSTGDLTLRDTLSPEPVTMHLGAGARIVSGDRLVARADLRPGALVSITFDSSGKTPAVREVSILASTGETFVFVGRIEHLDLRRGLLVLVDPRDEKTYDLYFDPGVGGVTRELRQGMNVTIRANFDGQRYQSREIAVNPITRQ